MNRGFDEGVIYKDGYERTVECLYMKVNRGCLGADVHYHDYIEILYGVNCEMTVWINDEEVNFQTGDVVIINPRDAHFLKSHMQTSEYIVIKFSVSILKYDGQMPPELRYLIPLMKSSQGRGNIIKRAALDEGNIKNTVYRIFNEYTEEKFGYEIAIRSDILSLYLQMIRHWYEKSDKIFAENDEITFRIYQAADYAMLNYSDVTAQEMAKMCMVSFSYFSRSFKKVMGCGFSEFLNNIRIDNARRLLLTTSDNITKIAADTGFSSSSHFIYVFKKKTGRSPLSYKKEFKQEHKQI